MNLHCQRKSFISKSEVMINVMLMLYLTHFTLRGILTFVVANSLNTQLNKEWELLKLTGISLIIKYDKRGFHSST
jgi:hypothetical protein